LLHAPVEAAALTICSLFTLFFAFLPFPSINDFEHLSLSSDFEVHVYSFYTKLVNTFHNKVCSNWLHV